MEIGCTTYMKLENMQNETMYKGCTYMWSITEWMMNTIFRKGVPRWGREEEPLGSVHVGIPKIERMGCRLPVFPRDLSFIDNIPVSITICACHVETDLWPLSLSIFASFFPAALGQSPASLVEYQIQWLTFRAILGGKYLSLNLFSPRVVPGCDAAYPERQETGCGSPPVRCSHGGACDHVEEHQAVMDFSLVCRGWTQL